MLLFKMHPIDVLARFGFVGKTGDNISYVVNKTKNKKVINFS